ATLLVTRAVARFYILQASRTQVAWTVLTQGAPGARLKYVFAVLRAQSCALAGYAAAGPPLTAKPQ
ncbi:MAG TPA: hypothetical protein VGR35_22300, partial [Tepidisphaeraceae bacterium]|nr:hypothetical protein [Tepidisphaeraceae bacterium]